MSTTTTPVTTTTATIPEKQPATILEMQEALAFHLYFKRPQDNPQSQEDCVRSWQASARDRITFRGAAIAMIEDLKTMGLKIAPIDSREVRKFLQSIIHVPAHPAYDLSADAPIA